MFDYFKKIRRGEEADSETEQTGEKPKKDKLFIVIMIFLVVLSIIGLVFGGGITAAPDTAAKIDFDFRFNISDIVILAVMGIIYLIIRIRKGRNR